MSTELRVSTTVSGVNATSSALPSIPSLPGPASSPRVIVASILRLPASFIRVVAGSSAFVDVCGSRRHPQWLVSSSLVALMAEVLTLPTRGVSSVRPSMVPSLEFRRPSLLVSRTSTHVHSSAAIIVVLVRTCATCGQIEFITIAASSLAYVLQHVRRGSSGFRATTDANLRVYLVLDVGGASRQAEACQRACLVRVQTGNISGRGINVRFVRIALAVGIGVAEPTEVQVVYSAVAIGVCQVNP